MCIIAYKPKGIPLPFDFNAKIRNCMLANGDGAGFAMKKNGAKHITIIKGFWNSDAIEKELERYSIKPEDELIFHARIGTSGYNNVPNCHPFFVSSLYETITNPQTTFALPVVAHNGTLSEYVAPSSHYCDTIHFIHAILSKTGIQDLIKRSPELFLEVFRQDVGGSKFVMLFPDRDGVVINRNLFHSVDGILYSNYGYESKAKNYYSQERSVVPTSHQPKISYQDAISKAAEIWRKKFHNNATSGITMKRRYATITLREDTCIDVEIQRVHMRISCLETRGVILSYTGNRPRFVFSEKHPIIQLGAHKLKSVRDGLIVFARRTNILIIGDDRIKYRVLRAYKTGILMESLDGNKTKKWLNPVELAYNYISDYMQVAKT